MTDQPKLRVDANLYYQSTEYLDHDSIQLIEGEVIVPMPPIPKHQAIVGEIFFIFMTFAKASLSKAFISPIDVYLDAHNIYQPDVLYLKENSSCRVDEKRLVGAPELVVEVLSPSTAKFDRQEKYFAYEKHGVQEYWIVDPIHELIEVWVLTEAIFVRQGAYDTDDTFSSPILESMINVQDIFS